MIIYKYSAINCLTINNLKNNVLWFSSANDFKDMHDSNLPLKKIPINDLVKEYEEYLQKITIDQFDKRKFPKWIFDSPLQNELFSSNKTINSLIRDFKNHIGITCFSTNPCSKKMWQEYGDMHYGFCLCFDATIVPIYFKRLSKVKYNRKLYEINLASNNLDIELKRYFTTKLIKYNYEEEYRLFNNVGPNKYDKKSLIKVILGKNIANIDKTNLISIIKAYYDTNTIIECEKNKN